jgi:hypothetical protein
MECRACPDVQRFRIGTNPQTGSQGAQFLMLGSRQPQPSVRIRNVAGDFGVTLRVCSYACAPSKRSVSPAARSFHRAGRSVEPWQRRRGTNLAGAALQSASIVNGDDAMRELPPVRNKNSNVQVFGLPQGSGAGSGGEPWLSRRLGHDESQRKGLRPMPPGT